MENKSTTNRCNCGDTYSSDTDEGGYPRCPVHDQPNNILATESGHESKPENVWQSGYAAGYQAACEKSITDAAERIADKLMVIVKRQLAVDTKAQQGGVWVKASEFKTHKPVYRPYRKPSMGDEGEYDYGEIYVTEDDSRIYLDVDNECNYEHQSDERWKDYEILDESDNAYQELREQYNDLERNYKLQFDSHVAYKAAYEQLKEKGDKMAEVLEKLMTNNYETEGEGIWKEPYLIIPKTLTMAKEALSAWNGNPKKEGEDE
jgi:hypothetical protein